MDGLVSYFAVYNENHENMKNVLEKIDKRFILYVCWLFLFMMQNIGWTTAFYQTPKKYVFVLLILRSVLRKHLPVQINIVS